MSTTKITNSDRAVIIREAWNRAYLAAVLAVEPVRQHIGAAMRSAWADFRKARAEGTVVVQFTEAYEEQHARVGRAEVRTYLAAIIALKAEAPPVTADVAEAAPASGEKDSAQLCLIEWLIADALKDEKREGIPDQDEDDAPEQVVVEPVFDPRQDLIDRIARNDAAMERIEQQVRRNVEIYGMSGGVDHMHDLLDDMHTHGMNLRDDLKELSMEIAHLPMAMVPQSVQQQQAQALAFDPRLEELEDLRARLKDIQWDVDNLSGLCNSTFRYGSDRSNLDAHARLDEKWEEREDALNDVRRLEHALGISPLTTR